MKVNLIKDANGKVTASFESAAAGKPSVQAVLSNGEVLHVVEAAENYKADIAAFYKHHSN